jgi:hypothetical protein
LWEHVHIDTCLHFDFVLLVLQSWIVRHKDLGIAEKGSHGLSTARASVVTRESVRYFRDNVHAYAMQDCNDQRAELGLRPLSLMEKANFDEAQVDLCSFATGGELVLGVTGEKVRGRGPP